MKKEQILLVVAIALAALLIWGNLGLYESVDAASIPQGSDVGSSKNVDVDPGADLPKSGAKGRNYLIEFRTVVALPLPEVEPPQSLGLPWPAPAVSPRPGASAWGGLRHRFTPSTRPEKPEDSGAEDTGGEEEEEEEDAASILEEKNQVRPWEWDKIVKKDGKEVPCHLRPTGEFEDKPLWELLRAWPDVTFRVVQLDVKRGKAMGRYDVGRTEIDNTYDTIHLAAGPEDRDGVLKLKKEKRQKFLLNRYHEQRIRAGVRDQDREALIDHADWIMAELKPVYGPDAVKLAIAELEKAMATGLDIPVVTKLGETYRAAFDLDGEIDAYERALAERPSEPKFLGLLARAYFRLGALERARELCEKGAVGGDSLLTLYLAYCHHRMGDTDAARTAYETLQGGGDADIRAHALAGLCELALADGDVAGALTLAQRGKGAGARDPEAVYRVQNLTGVCQYFLAGLEPSRAESLLEQAESSFRAAHTINRTLAAEKQSTRPLSNLGMTLARQGRLDEAEASFQECIDSDALNYFDPLVGKGYVHQLYGERNESNDSYETAQQRVPRDPWVLLCLATVRLRDGLPGQAYVFATKALDAEPGIVDALRIAGLSALAEANGLEDVAQADKAYAQAVDFLRRASSMEPANAELIFDHARALIESGQQKKAVALLAETTDVRTGAGRQDARLLALLANAMFTGVDQVEAVLEALNRARRSNPDDATLEYVNGFRREITSWQTKRLWVENFERSSSGNVGNGWFETEAYGPSINLKKGVVVFTKSRSQGAEDRSKTTQLHREENLKQLISVEAGVKVGPETKFLLQLYKGNKMDPGTGGGKRRGAAGGPEVSIGCDYNGDLRVVGHFGEAGGGRKKGGTMRRFVVVDESGNTRKWPEDGQMHTLRLDRVDDAKGLFELYLDDERLETFAPAHDDNPSVKDKGIPTLAVSGLKIASGKYTLSFLVDAHAGADVDVTIDYVRLKRTTAR